MPPVKRFGREVIPIFAGVLLVFTIIAALASHYLPFAGNTIDFAGLFLASVAFVSLWVGWSKLYWKRTPQFTLKTLLRYKDGDQKNVIEFDLINTGEIPISPINLRYAYIEEIEEDKFLLSTHKSYGFNKSSLKPGNSCSGEIKRNVFALQPLEFNVGYGEHETLSKDYSGERMNVDLDYVKGVEGDIDYKLQRILKAAIEENRGIGRTYTLEELKDSQVNDLIEELRFEDERSRWQKIRDRIWEWYSLKRYGYRTAGGF